MPNNGVPDLWNCCPELSALNMIKLLEYAHGRRSGRFLGELSSLQPGWSVGSIMEKLPAQFGTMKRTTLSSQYRDANPTNTSLFTPFIHTFPEVMRWGYWIRGRSAVSSVSTSPERLKVWRQHRRLASVHLKFVNSKSMSEVGTVFRKGPFAVVWQEGCIWFLSLSVLFQKLKMED